MKRAILIATAIGLLASPALASTCNLVVNGKNLWHGTCYFKPDGSGGFSAKAHDYKCHAAGGPNKCTDAQACAGPWVTIFKDTTNGTLSSYWSIEDACHGGDTVDDIIKTGSVFRGKGYMFTAE